MDHLSSCGRGAGKFSPVGRVVNEAGWPFWPVNWAHPEASRFVQQSCPSATVRWRSQDQVPIAGRMAQEWPARCPRRSCRTAAATDRSRLVQRSASQNHCHPRPRNRYPGCFSTRCNRRHRPCHCRCNPLVRTCWGHGNLQRAHTRSEERSTEFCWVGYSGGHPGNGCR